MVVSKVKYILKLQIFKVYTNISVLESSDLNAFYGYAFIGYFPFMFEIHHA